MKTKKKNEDEDDFFGFALEKRQPVDLSNLKLPDEIPVLSSKDLSWNEKPKNGCMDLDGWLNAVFGTSSKKSSVRVKVELLLLEIIYERSKRNYESVFEFLESVFEHKLPSLKWQSAVWNEMLKRLGYKIPKKLRIDPGMEL